MRKKILSVILSISLVASLLVGCSSAKTETEQAATPTAAPAGDTSTGTTDATVTAAPTAEATATPAQTDGKTDTEKVNPTGKKYKIALSNSYMGNDWRQQMERIAEYVASQEPYKSRCELTIVNSDNDAESQSASIDALVQQGYDCILVDPASETGVNQAIKRANDAGVKIVVFDQPASVSSPDTWHIRIDGARSYSILATWMMQAIGGKGNVVLDQGLKGAAEADLEYNASKAVFAGNPDIKIVSDYQSNYGLSEGEQALASVIAANPDINAVTTQGYIASVVNAFKKAGLPIPVSCGGGYNGNLISLVDNNAQGIIDVYIAGLSAIALNYAIRIMDGEQMQEETIVDCAFIATSNDYDMGQYADVPIEVAKEGVNFFRDQPAELIWPAVPSTFGLDIPMSVVTGDK